MEKVSGLTKYLKIIGQNKILLDSVVIPYILKRSLKARLIWLTVKKETGLTVTVPRYYNIELLEPYLRSRSKWILRTLAKINDQKLIIDKIVRSNTVSYLGTSFNIHRHSNNNKVAEIKIEGDRLIVNLDPSFNNKPATEVELWLKNQAAITILRKIEAFSLNMKVGYNKVTIRNQKSRWGSCSQGKNLSFNWRLIMTPEPILEYVVVHELCHLREMNHSAKFWKLVSDYCPNWKEYRRWLTRYSYYLNAQISVD
jgi:predicted metal-dependent hydrolase